MASALSSYGRARVHARPFLLRIILMKRLLSAAIAVSLLGGCHFHSRSWLAQHADDSTPTTIVPDTQPVVRQEGAPATEKPAKKESIWRPDREGRASATKPMSRSSLGASDGRTVGMFLMANDVNLSFAKTAYSGAESDDVKAFARRMLTDHTQIVATIRALIADQDVTPFDDDASEDLRDLSTLQRDSLRARTGHAFAVERSAGQAIGLERVFLERQVRCGQ